MIVLIVVFWFVRFRVGNISRLCKDDVRTCLVSTFRKKCLQKKLPYKELVQLDVAAIKAGPITTGIATGMQVRLNDPRFSREGADVAPVTSDSAARLRRLRALVRPPPRGSSWLRRRERADRDVVSIRVSERELHRFSVQVQVGFLLESRDESARPRKGLVVVVDAEEQEEPVARCCLIRAHQGRMPVRAPLVEAEQDGSIRIQDLTKVVMGRARLGLAEERLVPFEAAGNVAYADNRPCAFHRNSAFGLTSAITRVRLRASDAWPC